MLSFFLERVSAASVSIHADTVSPGMPIISLHENDTARFIIQTDRARHILIGTCQICSGKTFIPTYFDRRASQGRFVLLVEADT